MRQLAYKLRWPETGTTGLGRFETLAPSPKLTSLTATLGPKADIPFGHVNADINGDKQKPTVNSERRSPFGRVSLKNLPPDSQLLLTAATPGR